MSKSPAARAVAILAAAVALGVAGCGGSDPSEEKAATPAPAATSSPTAAPDLTDTSTKPVVAKPSGDPPSRLVKKDIVSGQGPRAKAGDTITVHYAGVSFSTGAEFDASWNGGQPFTFKLGGGQVIPGWDRGLVGMRVGGRRQLTIPPDLAYGPGGSPPAIGPDETLIFVVDLQQIG